MSELEPLKSISMDEVFELMTGISKTEYETCEECKSRQADFFVGRKALLRLCEPCSRDPKYKKLTYREPF